MNNVKTYSVVIQSIFVVLLFIIPSSSQVLSKKSFLLKDSPVPLQQGILGNGIVDILVKDSVVWAATGYGLNKTNNSGQNWTRYTSNSYIGKGGVTAMTYMDEQYSVDCHII